MIQLMGIGDWGLGIGDWGLGPIPNPQSPIPNPQSPFFLALLINYSHKFFILQYKSLLSPLFKFNINLVN